MNFNGCRILNVNVGLIYINQFKSNSYNLVINANKSLKIKGPFHLISNSQIDFNTTAKTSSRVQIEIDYISTETISILSSWIDLIINKFNYTYKTYSYFPINLCIGYGGSSTATINNFNNITSASGDVSVEFDFTGFQTDKTLNELMKKEWNSIVIKSFDNLADDFTTTDIYFKRDYVYGFQKNSYNLLSHKWSVTNELVFSLSCSSFSTIPLILCLTSSSSCNDGIPITEISQISEMIPNNQKVVNLTISYSNISLDLSDIQKKISIFTVDADYPPNSVNSIKTNSNIDRLILKSLKFDTGSYQFDSNEVTFYQCQSFSSDSKLNFVFNKENCLIYSDINSLSDLMAIAENAFPLIYVNCGPYYHYKSLNVTEDYFIFSCSSYNGYISLLRKNIPKVVFDVDYDSYENAKPFSVYFSETTIDYIKIKFNPYNIKTDTQKMTVSLYDLDKITINSFIIDLENFEKMNFIDLNGYTWKDFLTINSKEYQLLNEGYLLNNQFCICKDEFCEEFCPEGISQLNYNDDFTLINQRLKEGIVLIQIVGNNDNTNIPILSFDSVDNNLMIVGLGQNPSVQIDCPSQPINNHQKMISFSKIIVNFHSNTDNENIYLSKVTFYDDCVIDPSSSSTLELVIDELICYKSHLVFKSILVQEIFNLIDSPANSVSSTKVSFGSLAKVYINIPTKITFSGSKLVFNNLEFDLASSIPFLTVSISSLIITGIDGNIEPLSSNVTINGIMRDLEFKGTWEDIDYTHFFYVSNLIPGSSFLYFESEIVPFYINTCEQYIVLLSNNVKLKGIISSEFQTYKKILIRTHLTEKVNFYINEIDVINSIDISFDSPNIDLKINKLNISNSKVKFTFMIDQYFYNTIKIFEKFESAAFQYSVNFYGFEGSLFDSEVVEFLKSNYTVLTVHDENTITPSNELFINDYINGFRGKNFKFTAIKNKLYFHLAENPELFLRIGSIQPGKNELVIKYEDLSSLKKYIPVPNAIVNILITCDITDFIFEFDKDDINIDTLNCFASNYTVYFKLGTSVRNLYAESLIINVPENDNFEIQKVNLTKNSKFNSLSNGKVESVSIDLDSFMVSSITDFSNEFNLSITESYQLLTINFTSFGIKLIYDETLISEIDVSKFPNANIVIDSKDSPLFNVEEGTTEIKQLKSFVINSKNIYLGSNWDKISLSNHLTLNSSSGYLTQTDSFPIDSWDTLYQYPIILSQNLFPNRFINTFNINNKNILVEFQQEDNYNFNNITFVDIIMSDHSSITFSKHNSIETIINKITIQNGISNIYNVDNNVLIQDEITLKKGSILNGNFSTHEKLKTLNLEWDLNESPFLNSSILQDTSPDTINIIYKGESVEGREKEFDEFLSNDFIIMKNFNNSNILKNIHFISLNNIKEFKDGNDLILKCKFVYNQSIKVFPIKYFSPDYKEDDIPTENPTTESFIPNKPTTDSFESSSSNIEFTEKGFLDGDVFVSTEANKNAVLFIKSNKNEIFLSTDVDSKPDKNLFVSPQEKNILISIVAPDDADYGTGSFGVHANSNNPVIILPQSKVPLNIFNDDVSEIDFQLNDIETSILLQKLTISDGDLILNLPKNVNSIEFEEVETFMNGKLKTIQDKMNSIEIKIGSLKINSDSVIKMINISFNNAINTGSNSRIEIEEKVKFNEKSTIEISDDSMIEFGKSVIEGIVNSIKIIKAKSIKNIIENEESESRLICGFNFDCISWLDKIVDNESNQFFNCTKIENDENCLIISNMKQSPSKDPEKKKLSTTIIVVIVVVIVLVLAAVIISIIFVIWRKKHKEQSEKEEETTDKYISDYV